MTTTTKDLIAQVRAGLTGNATCDERDADHRALDHLTVRLAKLEAVAEAAARSVAGILHSDDHRTGDCGRCDLIRALTKLGALGEG